MSRATGCRRRGACSLGGGDNVVSSVGECGKGHELGRLSRRSGNSSHAALESGDALLKDVDGGVADTAVDVAKLLEAKETGTVRRVVEGVRRGRVDGDGARVGGRVRLLTGRVSAGAGRRFVVAVAVRYVPGVELEGFKVLAVDGHRLCYRYERRKNNMGPFICIIVRVLIRVWCMDVADGVLKTNRGNRSTPMTCAVRRDF